MQGRTFGRYQLLDVVGRGGMGEVWRAFDTATDRAVAIKVLPPHLVNDVEFRERFQREARSAASLSEPHIVPIYDFGEIDGHLYVTMQLVNGHDLTTLLHHGPLHPQRAVAIIEQIAAALGAAHRTGLIHRDVKPSNILITDNDFAYLIDFGIARAAGDTSLTGTGATIGTMEYMAPERFETGIADTRSDIYALTCVLYQTLTGRAPFPAASIEQLIRAQLLTPPPRPSESNPHLPMALDRVIETGMAKDPRHRYTTTREMAQAARAAIGTADQQPAPAAVRYPAADQTYAPQVHARQSRHASRRKLVMLVTGGCAIALIVLVGIVLAVRPSTGDHDASASQSSTTTPTAPPLTGAIGELLLNFPDLGNALHDPNAWPSNPFDRMPNRISDNVSPRACAAIYAPAQTAVYEGSSPQGFYPWHFTDGSPRETALRWGTQALIQFSTATRATAFYEKSTALWSNCGRHFTNEDTPYDVEPISNTDRILSTRYTSTAASCGRALAVRNNVIIDVMVCNRINVDDEPAARRVAERIAARIHE